MEFSLKIDLTFAKLSPADRELAQSQQDCPVLAERRLGSMGVPVKLLRDGKPLFLCCAGCVEEAGNPSD